MSFYATVILILSVVYVLYIAFQLHSDYKRSRPLEGQAEEHFTFNPENTANVNPLKVTMNEDGISLEPEYQVTHPTYGPMDKSQEDMLGSKQPLSGKISSNPSINNSGSATSSPPIYSHSSPNKNSFDAYPTIVVKEKNVIPKTRAELFLIHMQELLSKDYTSEELREEMKKGTVVMTEVIEEPDNNLEDNNNLDKASHYVDEDKVSSSYAENSDHTEEQTSYAQDFDTEDYGSYDPYSDEDILLDDETNEPDQESCHRLDSEDANNSPADSMSETKMNTVESPTDTITALNSSTQNNVEIPSENLPSYLTSTTQIVASKINDLPPVTDLELEQYDFSSLDKDNSEPVGLAEEIQSEAVTNNASNTETPQADHNRSNQDQDTYNFIEAYYSAFRRSISLLPASSFHSLNFI